MLAQIPFLILLATLKPFDPVSSQNCLRNGKWYSPMTTTVHESGCYGLQCQFGKYVRIFERCGNELDGTCHYINRIIPYQNTNYVCQKIQVGEDIQYKYEVVTPGGQKSCVEGGQTYQSLEKFRRGDGCREYQCQDGVVVPLDAVCGKEIDGKCHVVGEIFEKEGTAYICTERSLGDEVVYENVVLVPQPVSKRVCLTAYYSFQNYETLRQLPICNLRQCQDQNVKVLTNECAFKREDIKCYKRGEQWRLNDIIYSCVFNESTQQATSEILLRVNQRCHRSGKWYEHLQIAYIARCDLYQCQDGQMVPLNRDCPGTDVYCHPINVSWYDKNGSLLKCVLDSNGQPSIIPYQAPASGN